MGHGEAGAGSDTGDLPRGFRGSHGGLAAIGSDAQGDPEASGAVEARDGDPGTEAGFLEVFQHHSGPLPPVDTLAGYDRVVPGSAKAIIDSHINGERTTADAVRRLTRAESFGVAIGAVGSQVLTIGGLAAAVVLLIAGFPSESIAAVVPSILSGAAMVVSAYRKGKS